MFVRDEDRIDGRQVFADRRETFAKLPHAEPRVDQDARLFGRKQRRIPRTAACQHAELDDDSLLKTHLGRR